MRRGFLAFRPLAALGLCVAAFLPACFPEPFILPDATPPPQPDAVPIDAPIDAPPDAVPIDAPPPDAVPIDAPVDASPPDAVPIDAPPPDAVPIDAPQPDVFMPPDAGVTVTAVIGPSGGMLSSPGGVTVIIPRHALDAPTTISIMDSFAPAPSGGRTAVAKLGPEGIVFHRPVTVDFAASYVAGETPGCFWTTLGGDTFEDIGGAASTDGVSCSVIHFSQGYAGLSTGMRTVYGVEFGTFIDTDSTIESFPYDISMSTLNAIVPDGHGGYTTIVGKGTNMGTFSVPNVPTGDFFLFDDGTYLETTGDTFDLGNDFVGRPDVVEPTMTSDISFNVTNLSAWSTSDDLELYAPNADTWFPDLAENLTAGLPAVGATSINSLVLDTLTNSVDSAGDIGNLLDDDPAYLAQLTLFTLAGGTPYQALSRVFQPTPFMQTDGMPTSVSGAFVQLQLLSSTFDLESTQFAAVTGMGPNAKFGGAQLTINAQPTGVADGQFSNNASLVFFPSTKLNESGTVNYGMPPSGTWAAIGNSVGFFEVDFALQGATALAQFAVLEHDDTIANLTRSAIVPVLGPIGNPTVGGKDATQASVAGVGLAPTIAWQEPTLGMAGYYIVVLNQLSVTSGATQAATLAAFFTRNTSISLPTGLLATGQSYYLELIAADDGLGPTQPSRAAIPRLDSSSYTGIFTP